MHRCCVTGFAVLSKPAGVSTEGLVSGLTAQVISQTWHAACAGISRRTDAKGNASEFALSGRADSIFVASFAMYVADARGHEVRSWI